MIDLAVKYAKELDQRFTRASQTLKHMKLRGEFKDEGGVQSVFFYTVDTSDFLQPHTKAAFGNASEVKSSVVRKDIELFYEIHKVLSAVQIQDTAGAFENAGKIMQAAVEETYAPLLDKLSIGAAIKAAKKYGGEHIVSYDANNPLKALGKAVATLKNQRSDSRHQTLFIAASAETDFDENLFKIHAPVVNDGVVTTGEIKTLKGIKVEIVPDDIFCTYEAVGEKAYTTAKFTAAPKIKAILWDDRVMGYLEKISDTYVFTGEDAIKAGYDGALLRGLFRPGAWVFDANETKKGIVILEAV